MAFFKIYFSKDLKLEIGTFFEALKSERRLDFVKHELDKLVFEMNTLRQHADPFSNLEELMNKKKSWSKFKNRKVAQADKNFTKTQTKIDNQTQIKHNRP